MAGYEQITSKENLNSAAAAGAFLLAVAVSFTGVSGTSLGERTVVVAAVRPGLPHPGIGLKDMPDSEQMQSA